MTSENWIFLRHPDGLWLLGHGTLDWQSNPPANVPAFFLPAFDGQGSSWCVPEFVEELSDREFGERMARWETEVWALKWQQPDRQEFFDRVRKIKELIHQGSLTKAVPVAIAKASGAPNFAQKMRMLQQARAAHHRLIAYGGWWDQEGLIGLTPEILFSNYAGFVETMALAGTAAARGANLLEDAKEMNEHRWVVCDIEQQLTGKGGPVKKTPTREWIIGALKHLRTDIGLEANLKFEELVRLLHPTAALGGYPRGVAQSWLREQPEWKPRRRFGAPFGLRYPDGTGFCVVAIRNVQWQGGQVTLASGCGVVAESQPEREWDELSRKRQSVIQLLGL